jgi:hypothetical protein
MILLIGIVIGALSLLCARHEKELSRYATTATHQASHVRQARVYKTVGWVLIALCVALPVFFIGMFLLFPPEFTF